MSGRRRRELADSFRLVTGDEQWFLRDLLVGVVAAVVWIGGTGALAVQVADVLGVSLGLAAGESPSPLAVGLFAVLWLAVPAVAVTVRIRRRTLNLRGNVEQYYRFEHPATLLAPPTLLVVVAVVVGLALGGFPWYFSLVLLPVGLFALVRTLAFTYRVYSFSHPLVVQFLAVVSTVVAFGSALAAVGTATGRGQLAERALRAAGLPAWVLGSVSVEGFVVSGVAAVAAFPLALALAYVLIQTVVSLGVRLVEPDVDRSSMRTGQRYPPFLDSTTPVGTPADTSDSSAGSTGTDTDTSTADRGPTESDGDGTDSEDSVESDDDGEDLDDVSNTRVFTPPADDGDGGFGSTTAGETNAVPGTDDEGTSSTGGGARCDACGESFSMEADVRFCPNCGTSLAGE
ncbi:zinc ribbon domain-containing protein [Halobacteria archaeon HArc-gm2]|nr:zinc ribbon domain-containing protein [Halobacteria archaeon HArc-gm2]